METIAKKDILLALNWAGLSEKESAFYVALLELGPSSIQTVTRHANIKRTSAYNFINSLAQLGLVSFYERNNRLIYQAEDPSHLKKLLQQRIIEFDRQLPQLTALYHQQASHPKTKVFTGVEGMKKTVIDSLNSKEKKVLVVIDLQSAIGNFGIPFWERYNEEATRRRVIVHSLRHDEQKYKIPTYKYLTKKEYQKMLLVPRYLPKHVRIPNTLVIYDETVVIISPSEENWVLVTESTSFSTTIKMMYSLLWTMSKP